MEEIKIMSFWEKVWYVSFKLALESFLKAPRGGLKRSKVVIVNKMLMVWKKNGRLWASPIRKSIGIIVFHWYLLILWSLSISDERISMKNSDAHHITVRIHTNFLIGDAHRILHLSHYWCLILVASIVPFDSISVSLMTWRRFEGIS